MQEDIIAKIVRWMAALVLTICAICIGTIPFSVFEWQLIHWNFRSNDISTALWLLLFAVVSGFFAWKLWRGTFPSYGFSFFTSLFIIYIGSTSVPLMVSTLWQQQETLSIAAIEVVIILCTVGILLYVKKSKSVQN